MRLDAVDYDMLAFGIKKGMFLTVPQIKKIYQERKWPYPDGSGPKGVTHRFKKDFAKDLISWLWPMESEESQLEMFVALMGKANALEKDHDSCDASMLEVISGLDPENAEAAKGVRKVCWDKLSAARDTNRKNKDGSSEWRGGWQKQNFTPPELRELLPPTETVVWIKRLPQSSTYTGFYDRCWTHNATGLFPIVSKLDLGFIVVSSFFLAAP